MLPYNILSLKTIKITVGFMFIKALYKNFSLFEKEILKEVKIQAKLKNKTTKKSFLKLDSYDECRRSLSLTNLT